MRRKLLLWLCLLGIAVVSHAKDVEFTLSSAGNHTVDGVTVSFAQSTGSSAPAWNSGKLRLYANNTVTFSSPSKKIKNIVIDWEKQGSKTFATATAAPGTYSHPTTTGEGRWTGEANTVVITLGSSGQLQLSTFKVTIEDDAFTWPTANFNPNGGSVNVGDQASVNLSDINNVEGDWTLVVTSGVATVDNSDKYSHKITFTTPGEVTVQAIATKKNGTETHNCGTATYNVVDPTGAVDLTDTQFAWSASSYSATIGGTNSFPTLTNNESVAVTYGSSNTGVATINSSTGNITLVGAGTTTISAVSTATNSYNSKTVSYTLNVSAASGGGGSEAKTYTLVEITNGLSANDEIIFAVNDGGWKAMTLNGTTAGVYSDTQVSGNVITEASDIAVFVVEDSGNSDYPFAFKHTADNKYIGNTGKANFQKSETITTGYQLKYTPGASNNQAIECNNTNNQKYLSKNVNNIKFYTNTSTYLPLKIFKLDSSEPVTPPTPTPSITVASTLDLGSAVGAAPESQTLTVTGANLDAPITYSWGNGASSPFTAVGTLTATGGELTVSLNTSEGGSYSDNLILTSGETSATVEVSASIIVLAGEGEGTHVSPYNVARARDIIDKGLASSDEVYISGIITDIEEVSVQYGNATYNIADNASSSDKLYVYRGKYINNAKFTDANQIKVNDKVEIKGILKKHDDTKEIAQNNFIVTLTRDKVDAIITAPTSLEVTVGSTTQIEASVTSNATLSYTSSNTDVATVSTTGEVTGVAKGTAVITVSAEETDEYKSASAEIEVTVLAPVAGIPQPIITPNGGDFYQGNKVTLSGVNTDNYFILYNVDEAGVPTEDDLYTEPFALTETGDHVVKTVAYDGDSYGDVASATFNVHQVPNATFSVEAGAVRGGTQVEIPTISGLKAYCVTDLGEAVDPEDIYLLTPILYEGPITITEPTTLYAIYSNLEDTYFSAEIAQVSYTLESVPDVTFTPEGGSVAKNTEVALSVTGEYSIKYTTDRSDPKSSATATVYDSATPITVDKAMTIKAVAYYTVDDNNYYGAVGEQAYRISQPTAAEDEYVLVTDPADLTNDAEVILAAQVSGEWKAMVLGVKDNKSFQNDGIYAETEVVRPGTIKDNDAIAHYVIKTTGDENYPFQIYYPLAERYIGNPGSGNGIAGVAESNKGNTGYRFKYVYPGTNNMVICSNGAGKNYLSYNSNSTGYARFYAENDDYPPFYIFKKGAGTYVPAPQFNPEGTTEYWPTSSFELLQDEDLPEGTVAYYASAAELGSDEPTGANIKSKNHDYSDAVELDGTNGGTYYAVNVLTKDGEDIYSAVATATFTYDEPEEFRTIAAFKNYFNNNDEAKPAVLTNPTVIYQSTVTNNWLYVTDGTENMRVYGKIEGTTGLVNGDKLAYVYGTFNSVDNQIEPLGFGEVTTGGDEVEYVVKTFHQILEEPEVEGEADIYDYVRVNAINVVEMVEDDVDDYGHTEYLMLDVHGHALTLHDIYTEVTVPILDPRPNTNVYDVIGFVNNDYQLVPVEFIQNSTTPQCQKPTINVTGTAIDDGIDNSYDIYQPFYVTITAGEGEDIYYTVDGNTPYLDKFNYSGGQITFSEAGAYTIKAVANKDGHVPSEVASVTVLIKDPTVADAYVVVFEHQGWSNNTAYGLEKHMTWTSDAKDGMPTMTFDTYGTVGGGARSNTNYPAYYTNTGCLRIYNDDQIIINAPEGYLFTFVGCQEYATTSGNNHPVYMPIVVNGEKVFQKEVEVEDNGTTTTVTVVEHDFAKPVSSISLYNRYSDKAPNQLFLYSVELHLVPDNTITINNAYEQYNYEVGTKVKIGRDWAVVHRDGNELYLYDNTETHADHNGHVAKIVLDSEDDASYITNETALTGMQVTLATDENNMRILRPDNYLIHTDKHLLKQEDVAVTLDHNASNRLGSINAMSEHQLVNLTGVKIGYAWVNNVLPYFHGVLNSLEVTDDNAVGEDVIVFKYIGGKDYDEELTKNSYDIIGFVGPEYKPDVHKNPQDGSTKNAPRRIGAPKYGDRLIMVTDVKYNPSEGTTGVDNLQVDAVDDPNVEWYTLQGVRVERPAAGNVYIRVAGGVPAKVLVK